MERSGAIIKVYFFYLITCSLHLSSAAHLKISMRIMSNESFHPENASWVNQYADGIKFQVNTTLSLVNTEQRFLIKGTHSLQVFAIGITPGINFPQYISYCEVDGEQVDYYDSNIRKVIQKTAWMKKVTVGNPDYWNKETQILQNNEEKSKVDILTLMERFNQTDGVHVVQNMYGCEFDDDDIIREYDKHSYDGEDWISYDPKLRTYTAANEQAVNTKHIWEASGYAGYAKFYLEKNCITWLKSLLSYGRESLERKDRPEVFVFQKRSNASELVCHATGYFPRGLMIFWDKDGEEVLEDVDIRATLPNQDGSFQRRAILRVSSEDLKKHEYKCVVQHSSLLKDLVLPVPNRDGGFLGAGTIAGIVLGAIAGVVMVAVGILMWTKTNTAFRIRSSSSSSPDSSQVSTSE